MEKLVIVVERRLTRQSARQAVWQFRRKVAWFYPFHAICEVLVARTLEWVAIFHKEG